jgi:hypothetical protein
MVKDRQNQSLKGIFMATGNDMNAHNQTYSGVMSLLKWGTAASVVVTIIVVLVIAS